VYDAVVKKFTFKFIIYSNNNYNRQEAHHEMRQRSCNFLGKKFRKKIQVAVSSRDELLVYRLLQL